MFEVGNKYVTGQTEITGQTCFFRDILAFHKYAKLIGRLLGKPRDILSLPCSTGQEPYSIALLTKESGNFPFHIHGIDINDNAIKFARKAEYWCGLDAWSLLLHYYGKNWVSQFPTGSLDHIGVRISEPVKQHISFSAGDVLDDKVDGKYDVMFCCNFLYMLNCESKTRTLENMLPALKQNGFLVLDTHMRPESFIEERYRERQRRHNKFLDSMPGRFGLDRLGNAEIYQKR